MEYSLTRTAERVPSIFAVLILILMEYSLTIRRKVLDFQVPCLNPYSNGILTDNNKN